MKATSLLLLWTLLLLSIVPAEAQESAAPPPADLTLGEALRTALKNNLQLVLEIQNPAVAEQQVIVEDATFDGAVTARADYQKTKQEALDPFSGDTEIIQGSVGWEKNLRFGGSYSVNLSSGRFDRSAPLFRTPTSYDSSLGITVDLPLFRGLGAETAQAQLILARTDLEISRQELRRRAELTLQQVEESYWNLAGARAALEVARKSLGLAGDLLSLNRKKVDVGTLAPIEITQAEAGVASREEGVILAETALLNAEDALRRLMGIPPDDPLWERPIVPVDTPVRASPPLDVPRAIDAALAQRMEVAAAREQIRSAELRERVARNALKPDLGLQVALTPGGNNFSQGPGPDGLFGTLDDEAVVTGSLGESISEIGDFTNYTWRTSLAFRLPVGNRAARASHRIAEIQRESAGIGLRSLEQDIRVEVRNAAREVESGLKRVEAARANVDLQRKKLEAEQKKFENGMSTSFEVLTFQTDLAEAEVSEIRAVLDYNVALAALQTATGSILESRGLAFQP